MTSAVPKTRVLIVEDERVVARDIEQQLTELGYQCAGSASTGEQALALVQSVQPDLVLMDIQLAGAMDGITAAQQIRDQFALPVVFLTAYTADDVLARAKLTEPFGYILKPFSERELRTVLSMALYKHQAETQLRNSTRQLQALSRRVLQAQEQERRRIAIELHDELGQSLTAIKINLQISESAQGATLDELRQDSLRIVESALQHVRSLATALRPSMLDDLGLVPALRWLVDQSAQRGVFAIDFESDVASVRLDREIETACFRIVQEALTNVNRHAQAQRVHVRLHREAQSLLLQVQDDGQGFDLPAMQARAQAGGSLGVLGMQERAKLVGGVLDIGSAPGGGTQLQFRCPWSTQEACP